MIRKFDCRVPFQPNYFGRALVAMRLAPARQVTFLFTRPILGPRPVGLPSAVQICSRQICQQKSPKPLPRSAELSKKPACPCASFARGFADGTFLLRNPAPQKSPGRTSSCARSKQCFSPLCRSRELAILASPLTG